MITHIHLLALFIWSI